MKINVIAFAILIFVSGYAVAGDGVWTTGFAQGVAVSSVNVDGYSLTVNCSDGAESYSSVGVYDGNGMPPNDVKIKAGGITYDGSIESDSMAGEQNFQGFLRDSHKDVVVVDIGGKKITFPKANSDVPLYGEKDYRCKTLNFEGGASNAIADKQPVQQSEKPPVDITISMDRAVPNSDKLYPNLKVVSLVNGLVIKSISINEGNCKGFNNPQSIPMKMGKTFGIPLGDCTVIKVDVMTDRGAWTFNFR